MDPDDKKLVLSGNERLEDLGERFTAGASLCQIVLILLLLV